MTINKFGLPLEKVANSTYYYHWNGLLRNYVRDNAVSDRGRRKVAQDTTRSATGSRYRCRQQTVRGNEC